MAAADRTFAALAARQAGRRLQPTSPLRSRGIGGPPRRPAAPRLDPGRHHRHGLRPGPAAPVGALLRQERMGGGGQNARTRPAARVVLPKLLDQYKLVGKAARHEGGGGRLGGQDEPDHLRLDAGAGRRRRGRRPGRGHRPRRRSARRCRWPPTSSCCATTAGPRRSTTPSRPAASTATASASTPATRPTPGGTWPATPTPATAVACLILGAYQCAFDRTDRGGDFLNWEPYPRADAREKVKTGDAAALLAAAEDAIKNKDQAGACAAVQRYGDARPSGTSGARPAAALRRQRGRGAARREVLPHHVGGVRGARGRPSGGGSWSALARVTASEYGRPAPGYAEACKLLKV